MKALVIAEKPSLMREIRDVYEKHKDELPYDADFFAQRGHLVTLKMPKEIDPEQAVWKWENLPFYPKEHGGWQYKIIEEKRVGNNMTASERYHAIKQAVFSGQYDFVINAGDPDQEGELLIRNTLKKMGSPLPVKRFWTNDLTEGQILNALKNLTDDDHDPMLVNLYNAALGRQRSDYLFGMNISEAASLQMKGRAACGRVKTPILAIVVRRENEIRNFKPHTVYGVTAHYSEGFDGLMVNADILKEEKQQKKEKPKKEDGEKKDEDKGVIWFETKEEADACIASLPGSAEVVSVEKKRVSTAPPKLFKLATAQVAAGRMGYSDNVTQAAIQSLYEKKVLSYPRTDCEYLASDEDFKGFLKAVMDSGLFQDTIRNISAADIERVRRSKRWVNDKALKDTGHSALRPTTKPVDLDSLSRTEKDIYTLICRQFVGIFLPPLIQDKTVLTARAGDQFFRSTGKTTIDPGYTAFFGTKLTDAVIPVHTEGDLMIVDSYDRKEKTSVCPKPYTSPGIIEVCENPAKFLDDQSLKALGKRLKIGTPATRSGIIRQLIDRDGFLCEKKEKKAVYIHPTPQGERIIENLDGCSITKVDMTGRWEEELEDVRQGRTGLGQLEESMQGDLEGLLDEIHKRPMKPLADVRQGPEKIGICPKCGRAIIKGKKGYYCEGWNKDPKCGVGAYGKVCDTPLTPKEFMQLLGGETIEKKLQKGQNTWTQKLKYDFDACRIVFVKEEARESDFICPECGEKLIDNGRTLTCKDCGLTLWRNFFGHTLTNDEMSIILSGKRTALIGGLTSQKAKKPFSGYAFYDREKKRVGIGFAEKKTAAKPKQQAQQGAQQDLFGGMSPEEMIGNLCHPTHRRRK